MKTKIRWVVPCLLLMCMLMPAVASASPLPANQPPQFTSDDVNIKQIIPPNSVPSALIVQDADGSGDIVSFAVISGSLPTGIAINNDGTFTGSAAVGDYTATIEVTDQGGAKATTTLQIIVDIPITNIIFSCPKKLVGETFTYTPTIVPSDATPKTKEWWSRDPEIATVDQNGVITTHSLGEATIVFRITNWSGGAFIINIPVAVQTPVTGTEIVEDSITIYKDHPSKNTAMLTTLFTPSNASNKDIWWYVYDRSMVSVNTHGLVTAKEVGTTTVRAIADDTRIGTFYDMCTVTVEQSMTDLAISETTRTLIVNDPSNKTITLSYTITPHNTNIKQVAWTSTNESVATVDNNGVVTAVGTGTAQIRISITDTADYAMSCVCDVTVGKYAESISFDNPSASIDVGAVASVDSVLPYTILPVDALDKSVKFTSSNEAVATVTGGMITGAYEGITKITVESAHDPSVKSEIMLVVSDPIPQATPSDKLGNVVGKLIDSVGNPLVGYNVTLCSDPQTVITDANGVFEFMGVSYDEHALIVNSPALSEIGRFTLSFVGGSTSSAVVDNDANHIGITYTRGTIALDVLLQANAGITEFDAGTVVFTTHKQEYAKNPEKKVANPATGDWC